MILLRSARLAVVSRRKWVILLAVMAFPVVSSGFFAKSAIAETPSEITSPQLLKQMQLPARVLTVTGQGIESIPTTLTQISLGVKVEADTAEVAQQQAAQRQTAVIEWLRSQNVEALETTGISLNPRYDYIDNRQVLRGYQASNTVSFRLPTAAAGDVIDGAVNAGATQVDGVSFVAEDSAIESARQRALEAAVQDAQQQADTVLRALGLSRQEVVNISIGSVSAPPPSPVTLQRSQLADEAASTPVVGRSQSIDAQVTLHIRY